MGGASKVKNKFLLTMIMYLCSKLALAFVYESLYILSLHSEAAFYLSNKNLHVVTFNYAAKFEDWEGVLLKQCVEKSIVRKFLSEANYYVPGAYSEIMLYKKSCFLHTRNKTFSSLYMYNQKHISLGEIYNT